MALLKTLTVDFTGVLSTETLPAITGAAVGDHIRFRVNFNPSSSIYSGNQETAVLRVSETGVRNGLGTSIGGTLSSLTLDVVNNVPSTFFYTIPAGFPSTDTATFSIERTDQTPAGRIRRTQSITIGTSSVVQPDVSITTSPSRTLDIGSTATSWPLTISNGNNTTDYVLRLGNTEVARERGNGTETITTGLPSTGNSTVYRLLGVVPVSRGGDNTEVFIKNITVSRISSVVQPDVNITTSPSSTLALSSTATSWALTISDGSDTTDYRLYQGTVLAGINRGNGSETINQGLPTAGNRTVYRLVGVVPVSRGGDNTEVFIKNITVSRSAVGVVVEPDVNITTSPSRTLSLGTSATSWTLTISNGSNTTDYRLYRGTLLVGTNRGNGSETITQGLPSEGNSTIYRLLGVVPGSRGGDNTEVFIKNITVSRSGSIVDPDVSITTSPSSTLALGTTATSWTLTISNGSETTDYVLRLGSTEVARERGNGSETITTGLPTEGNSTTYRLLGVVPGSRGGNSTEVFIKNITVTRPGTIVEPDVSITTSPESTITLSATAPFWALVISNGSNTTDYVLRLAGVEVARERGNGTENVSTGLPGAGRHATYRLTGVVPVDRGGDNTEVFIKNIIVFGPGGGPETGVDITTDAENYRILSTATSFNVVIGGGNDYTIYTLYVGGVAAGSRTGNGTVAVSSTSALIPGTGIPYVYDIYGKVGESGTESYAKSITLTKTSTLSAVAPRKDSYGIAVYDNNNTFVTSFTRSSFLPRIVAKGSTTLSTTARTTVTLSGLGGLSDSNSRVVVQTNENGNAFSTRPTRSVPAVMSTSGTNGTLTLGSVESGSSVNYTVFQNTGPSVSNSSGRGYGVEIRNGAGRVIIDEFSKSFAVKEMIRLNSSRVTKFPTPTGSAVEYLRVSLTAGRYLVSDGPPLACISYEDGDSTMVPPTVLSNTQGSGSSESFQYVSVVVPIGTPLSKWKIALLTTETPSYFGGSAETYGLRLRDDGGSITWDSSWRQAVGNNIITPGFTTGSTISSTRAVSSGRSGVTPPSSSPRDIEETRSEGQMRTLGSLGPMDPRNTYLMGAGAVSGWVHYFGGTFTEPESGTSVLTGGGIHVPSLTLTGSTSALAHMFRLGDGVIQSGASAFTLDSNSTPPAGRFILLRIT